MIRMQGTITTGANQFVQRAAIAALEGPRDEVEIMRLRYKARRDRVVQALNAIPGVSLAPIPATFYAFPDVAPLLGKKAGNHVIDTTDRLCDWLLDKAEAQVERRYTELGARRAQQGVAYSHVFWAITATKQHVRDFVQREGLSDNAMELRGELELLHLASQFFDYALYYIALGFEHERDRIGGSLRRRKGDR